MDAADTSRLPPVARVLHSGVAGRPYLRRANVVALLPVAGMSLVINGFNSTAWATHDRAMKRGRMTIILYGSDLLNLGMILLAAWWLRSVWALVIGTLTCSLISVVAGYVFLPGIQHRLRWERSAVDEVVHFGKWVFVSTLLTFFAMQSDRFNAGQTHSHESLGVYSIALVLAICQGSRAECSWTRIILCWPIKLRENPAPNARAFPTRPRRPLANWLLLCLGAVAVAPVFSITCTMRGTPTPVGSAQLLALSGWGDKLNVTTGHSCWPFGR